MRAALPSPARSVQHPKLYRFYRLFVHFTIFSFVSGFDQKFRGSVKKAHKNLIFIIFLSLNVKGDERSDRSNKIPILGNAILYLFWV